MVRGTVRTKRGGRLVQLDPLLDQTGEYCCNIEAPSASGSSIEYNPHTRSVEEAIENIYKQASPPHLRPQLAQRAHDWTVKLHSRMEAAGHLEIDHTQQLRYGLDGCGPDQVKLSLRRAIESDCLRSKDLSPKILSIWSHWYLKVDAVGYRLDGDVPLRYGIHVEIEWELPGPEMQVSKIVKRKYGGYVPYDFRCQTLYGKAAMEDSQTEPLSDPSTPSVSISEMSSRVKDFLGGSNRTGRLANKLSEYLQPSVEDCQSSKASQLRDRAAFMLGEIAHECESSQTRCDSSSQASGLLRLFRWERKILRAEIETIKEHKGDRFGRTNRPTERRRRWWRKSSKSAAQRDVDMQEHCSLDCSHNDESNPDHTPSATQQSTLMTAPPDLDFGRTLLADDDADDILNIPFFKLDTPNEETRLPTSPKPEVEQDREKESDAILIERRMWRARLRADSSNRSVTHHLNNDVTDPSRRPSIRDTVKTDDSISFFSPQSLGSRASSVYSAVAGSMRSDYPIGTAF